MQNSALRLSTGTVMVALRVQLSTVLAIEAVHALAQAMQTAHQYQQPSTRFATPEFIASFVLLATVLPRALGLALFIPLTALVTTFNVIAQIANAVASNLLHLRDICKKGRVPSISVNVGKQPSIVGMKVAIYNYLSLTGGIR